MSKYIHTYIHTYIHYLYLQYRQLKRIFILLSFPCLSLGKLFLNLPGHRRRNCLSTGKLLSKPSIHSSLVSRQADLLSNGWRKSSSLGCHVATSSQKPRKRREKELSFPLLSMCSLAAGTKWKGALALTYLPI